MLELVQLYKSFSSTDGVVPVLNGIDLTLSAGETLAVTGESGSGKSTLLHLIAGLDHPDKGEIRFEGTNIAPLGDFALAEFRQKKIGLVFQQFNLVPSLTVGQNISLQARLSGRYDPHLVDDLTARLGLEGLVARYPEQLSGGQQQRVAIGRTLANRPSLILADEPTGNLDETTAATVMALMVELVHETGAALIVATHSTQIAGRFNRHLHLSMGRFESAA